MDRLYEEMKKMSEEKFPGRRFIPGEGCKKPELVLVGEAPGGEEEKQGRPFVGKAGKNLSKFLAALGLERSDIYITNVVKLRPTKINPKTGRASNRPPDRDELESFTPYLHREIELLSPKFVVTLGNFALKAITGDKKAVIGDMHGKVKEMRTYKLFPLYHPASVIYNRSLKAVYDEDIKMLGTFI